MKTASTITQNLLFSIILLFSMPSLVISQTVCNPAGNIFIVSNYDGGVLNLVIDQNIPNLKIGVVSYEAIQINLSGTFVGNVTAVQYAGYNSSPSNNCGPNIVTTVINGAPAGAQTGIAFAPTVTNPNVNGASEITCLYDCDTTTNQGGCNTADEIVDYFLQVFQGSSVFAHRTQYNCYSGSVLLSAAGNCCTQTPPTLVASLNVSNASCNGNCDGTVTAQIQGGIPPYIVLWSNGDSSLTADSLCPGNYTVSITDSIGLISVQVFNISSPSTLSGTFSIIPDNGSCNGSVIFNPAGGNGAPYSFAWDSCGNAAGTISAIADSLCAGSCCVFVEDSLGCRDTFCITIPLTVGLSENPDDKTMIYPNPSDNGDILIAQSNLEMLSLTDISGREISFRILKQNIDGTLLHTDYKGLAVLHWMLNGQRKSNRILLNNK